MEDIKKSKRTSRIWKYYTRKPNFIASCNVCFKDYSYKTTVSNLTKHWRQNHQQHVSGDTTDCSDDEASNHSNNFSKSFEKEIAKNVPDSSSTWQYYEILDTDQFIAKCKICQKDVSYDSISDLREHAKEHNAEVSEDEEWLEQKPRRSLKNLTRRSNASAVWRFMKIIDEEARNALCLICKKSFSFATSVSNLRKHVLRSHPHVDFYGDTVESSEKKVIISTNGELYEIATSDGEKDPIQTNEIYLEDSMDDVIVEQIESPIPPKRKSLFNKKPLKRKLASMKPFQNTSTNIEINDTCDETPKQNTSTPNSLDLFAQYVVSLLKELPKHVSDQLQSDIIKQIFTAKIAFNAPYSVSLDEKAVTVTINKNTNNSMPEITVHNTSDVTMTETSDKPGDTNMQNGN